MSLRYEDDLPPRRNGRHAGSFRASNDTRRTFRRLRAYLESRPTETWAFFAIGFVLGVLFV